MALSAANLSDLRGKAKILLGISDDDASFHADAFAIYDTLANNATSTIRVTPTSVVLVGDDSGTDTITFAGLAADTLGDLIEAIESANANLVVTPLIDEDEVAASDLVRRSTTSIAGESNEATLLVERAAQLDLLIEGAVAGIETYLGRGLFSATYRERVFPREGLITLEQPNVTSVDVFSADPQDAITVRYDGSAEIATVEVTDTAVVLRSAGSTVTTTSLAFATYGDTGALATAIAAVADWSASARVTVPTSRLVRSPAWDANGQAVEVQYWDDWDGEHEIDYAEGQIRIRIPDFGSAWGYRGMGYCSYTAGWTTLPKDIENVVLNVVKATYDATSKDGSVISERLGDYSYTLASQAFSGGSGSAAIVSQLPVLERYRRFLP